MLGYILCFISLVVYFSGILSIGIGASYYNPGENEQFKSSSLKFIPKCIVWWGVNTDTLAGKHKFVGILYVCG